MQLISFAQSQPIYCNNQPIEHFFCPSHTLLSHKHTLIRCPVGPNFSLSLSLIFDAPCITLIMYLPSAQMSAMLNTFECLKRQTHHREAGGWLQEVYLYSTSLLYALHKGFHEGEGAIWGIFPPPLECGPTRRHFSLPWNMLHHLTRTVCWRGEGADKMDAL